MGSYSSLKSLLLTWISFCALESHRKAGSWRLDPGHKWALDAFYEHINRSQLEQGLWKGQQKATTGHSIINTLINEPVKTKITTLSFLQQQDYGKNNSQKENDTWKIQEAVGLISPKTAFNLFFFLSLFLSFFLSYQILFQITPYLKVNI